MSAWDREATLAQYEAMLGDSEDPEALMESLGTPTRLAIELARTYVPSPAPERAPELEDEALTEAEAVPDEPVEEAPEQIQWELDPAPEEVAEPATVQVVKGGALAAYLVPAILIGLPIAVCLICLGLPFILSGGALLVTGVQQALRMIALLPLISDILLVIGAALCACAVGLLLVWLGLWISMELCWLWADRVLLALGRKFCVKEVPAP